MKTLKGISASRGIAIGPAFHFLRADLTVNCYAVRDPAAEWARFESAMDAARRQLELVCLEARAGYGAEQAEIFEAQGMMLDDPELTEAVRSAIEGEGIN